MYSDNKRNCSKHGSIFGIFEENEQNVAATAMEMMNSHTHHQTQKGKHELHDSRTFTNDQNNQSLAPQHGGSPATPTRYSMFEVLIPRLCPYYLVLFIFLHTDHCLGFNHFRRSHINELHLTDAVFNTEKLRLVMPDNTHFCNTAFFSPPAAIFCNFLGFPVTPSLLSREPSQSQTHGAFSILIPQSVLKDLICQLHTIVHHTNPFSAPFSRSTWHSWENTERNRQISHGAFGVLGSPLCRAIYASVIWHLRTMQILYSCYQHYLKG